MRYLSPKIRAAFTASQEAFSRLSNKSQESIAGIKAIKALGQEQQDAAAFEAQVQETIQINKRVARIDAMFGPMATLIMTISYVIMITYGGSLVVNQAITIGQLVSFSTYLGLLVWPMFGLGQLFNVLERGNASYIRVQNILSEKSAVVEKPNAVTTRATGDLVIDVTAFSYPDDAEENLALEHINFTVKAGETLGIVGRVGSGKTTLLKLLLRQFDDYQGTPIINNGKGKTPINVRRQSTTRIIEATVKIITTTESTSIKIPPDATRWIADKSLDACAIKSPVRCRW